MTAGATSIDGDVRLGEGVLSNVNRRRLVDGLAVSISERGFRDIRISDIVRHARRSRRTFYEETESLVRLLLRLTEREEWRRAGLAPIPRQLAVLLIGGLRELTATTVEDGNDVRDVTETAVAATIALLASS